MIACPRWRPIWRQVNVIVVAPAALAAKPATKTIPIDFAIGAIRFVRDLSRASTRPGGNLTGAAHINVEIAPKRLELLHELMSAEKVIGLLVNKTNPSVRPRVRPLYRPMSSPPESGDRIRRACTLRSGRGMLKSSRRAEHRSSAAASKAGSTVRAAPQALFRQHRPEGDIAVPKSVRQRRKRPKVPLRRPAKCVTVGGGQRPPGPRQTIDFR